MRNDFAVFILTYGRPDKVITLKTLLKAGYTGKYYLICSDDDRSLPLYIKRFGKDKVIVFNKDEAKKEFDVGDNFGNQKTIIYARNENFKIAKSLGLTYFLQLDDDYTNFFFVEAIKELNLLKQDIVYRYFDDICNAFIDFLETSKATTVAFAQGGDFLGGLESGTAQKGLLRKAMNSFFFRTDCPVRFVGNINEDVNTYVRYGQIGHLFFTITAIKLTQNQTQKTAGGMTDAYIDGGTYLKSFYSVMYAPSTVKISEMGETHRRIHHKIKWDTAVPKILRQSVKDLTNGE